jgi:phosphomannomutase
MVTASHLPADRNGFKFFTKEGGGFTKEGISTLISEAVECASVVYYETGHENMGSGSFQNVNYMPQYAETLRAALINEVCDGMAECSPILLPLAGLRIVLNAGNGAGTFFNDVLQELGADVTNSVGIVSDPTFPNGIPNPEDPKMVDMTKTACENCNADIGIMLDTDADRCGFIVPRIVRPSYCSAYEPLNRNRLIAFLGVIFSESSPGCTIVTDSCTSEGLERFLEKTLGLHHERYLKGYANVIGKAKELSASGVANAEVAIETSGHCAMKENGYLDDGTYTAVKVIGCLAKLARERRGDNGEQHGHRSLLELIADLPEMAEVQELRLNVLDGSLDTTRDIDYIKGT